jgi:crossover junction endodeoxyribonuclease RuvC
MGTAQASGVALLLAAEHGLPAATHTPSEVKAAITGYGSADKLQVQTMVARVLRLDALPQPADAAMRSRSPSVTRGGAARRDAASAAAAALTPAQRAWAHAEKAARR